jgi:transcriptional regulator with XRE-family HTH domain
MDSRFKKLGAFLKESRLSARVSQMDVAKLLGYSTPQFISNWERGLSAPPMSCLKKIAKLYHIKDETLFKLTLQEVEKEMRRQFR